MGLTESKPARLPRRLRAAVLGGEANLEAIAKYIRDGRCKSVVVLSGAGISVSAGIPDFRSPGTGLYSNLEKYGLPTPQSIFDINFFRENPRPFNHLARELYPGKFDPTLTHYFIRLLHEKGLLHRVITQNIDMLERRVGIPQEKLVEAHGTFNTSTCTRCGRKYDLPWLHSRIVAPHLRAEAAAGAGVTVGTSSSGTPVKGAGTRDGSSGRSSTKKTPSPAASGGRTPASPGRPQHSSPLDVTGSAIVPLCDTCDGVVKPDIVFFGEPLPERFWELQPGDMAACDLLIVMGTSLAVQPVAGIPLLVRPTVPRLLINREAVGETDDDSESETEGEEPSGEEAEAGADASQSAAPAVAAAAATAGSDDDDDIAALPATRAPRRSRGFLFRSRHNYRDVHEGGDTDAAVTRLAGLLGWEAELRTLADAHAGLLRLQRAEELRTSLTATGGVALTPEVSSHAAVSTVAAVDATATPPAPPGPALVDEHAAAVDAAGLSVLQHALADLDLGPAVASPAAVTPASLLDRAAAVAAELGYGGDERPAAQ